MSKYTVNSNWFAYLHTAGLRERLHWLAQLCASVDTIANFGCWDSEPFALLWTLDATEIKIIEKNSEHLVEPQEELEVLKKTNPGCLHGRFVEFIMADMTTRVASLSHDYFDLAYCEDVLYYMDSNLQEVQNAINEMARVVKPGGWVIAIESKIGAEFEEKVFNKSWGGPMRVQVSEPIDISSLFEVANLARVNLEGSPEYSYCYRKVPG